MPNSVAVLSTIAITAALVGLVVIVTETMNNPDTYITSVFLLCVTCQQPIRATITTANWVKVEWISPDGKCRGCSYERKEQGREQATDSGANLYR